MRTGFKKVTKKIGEILYLAVTSSDFNQNPLENAKLKDSYYLNQKQNHHKA
jgi:hypothetical protein